MANSHVEVDLSHHLSDTARNIRPNPLKAMYKYMDVPGLIAIAGGMPHPSLFPYDEISAVTLKPDTYPLDGSRLDNKSSLSWLWSLFKSSKSKTQLHIPKYADSGSGADPIQLSTALQYSGVVGLPPFIEFVRNFTLKTFKPAYPDFQVLANSGNTDGWTKAAAILCQPGELILTEEWTYPGALLSPWPAGVRPFPVPIDGIGMVPEKLEALLRDWKEDEHEGKRRPHVMYTIPVGQNPTGAVMDGQRKKDIYAICVKYDIIIVEDDPYYFLQFSDYRRKSERSLRSFVPDVISAETSRQYLDTLAPSYLKFDYQKRVIRLDTFSKTIGPGCRLGWTTCNAQFAAIMVDYSASTTNQTSGISQALITQLVSKQWGYDSFIRWLRGLATQYTARRDGMVDCFFECSSIGVIQRNNSLHNGAPVYDAFARPTGSVYHSYDEKFPPSGKTLFSFTIPNSGMFIWVTVYLKHRRDWVPVPAPGSALEFLLWSELAKGGVMVAPGYMFSTDESDVPTSTELASIHARSEYAHMRLSFSSASGSVLSPRRQRWR
ncbi:aminotransferase class I and II protein [Ceratobasidium sp. AG-Ba]|nr:aminotransferase class I and II protein [Ceratobasidium sp. AG-Ba]